MAETRKSPGWRKWVSTSGLLGLAILMGFSRPAVAADALEQTNVEISTTRDSQLGAHIAVADALGFFKAEGLDMTVHWTQSGADIITFLASGNQYLASGGEFPQLVLTAQGVPVKTIAKLSDLSGAQGLALGPGVKLNSPKDLEGKKLATVGGTPLPLILDRMAKRFGFDASKVQLVSMAPAEEVIASSKGDVAGMLGFEPFLHQLVTMGGTLYVTGNVLNNVNPPEHLPLAAQLTYYDAVLLARQEWIDTKPNTLKAVLRALLKADGVIKNDRPKAIEAIGAALHVDHDTLAAVMDENRYTLAIDDSLASGYQFVADWALDIKRIPNAIKPQDVIEPKLLKAIAPELVTWSGAK